MITFTVSLTHILGLIALLILLGVSAYLAYKCKKKEDYSIKFWLLLLSAIVFLFILAGQIMMLLRADHLQFSL